MQAKNKVSLYWLIVVIFLTIAVLPLIAVGVTALNTIAKEREEYSHTQIQNYTSRILLRQDEVEELLQRIAPTNTTRDLVLTAIYHPENLTTQSFSMIDYLILVNDSLPPPHSIDVVTLDSVVFSTENVVTYPAGMIRNWVKSIPTQKSQAYFKGNLGLHRQQKDVTLLTTIQPVYRSTNAIAPESIIGFVVVHYSFDDLLPSTGFSNIMQANPDLSLLKDETEEPGNLPALPSFEPGLSPDPFLDTVNATLLIDSHFQVLSDRQGFIQRVGILEDILPIQLEESGHYDLQLDGEKYQVHYQYIEQLDVYLLDITQGTVLSTLIRPYRGQTLVVLILCLLAIMGFGLGIRFVVLAPIFQIVKSLNEIQTGAFDWTKRIKRSWLREFDELVSLFNNFLDAQNRQKSIELALKTSESKYRSLFMNSPIPLIEQDLSGVLDEIHEIGLAGKQLTDFLQSNHSVVSDLVSKIRIIDVNHAGLHLLQAHSKDDIQENLQNIYLRFGYTRFIEQIQEMMNRTPQFNQVIELTNLKQRSMILSIRWSVFQENLDTMDRVVISMLDITEQEKSNRLRETLLKISQDADMVESIHDLYASIHNALAALMDVSNFYIASYDEQTRMISFPYFIDEFDPPPPDRAFGNGWTELVITSGKPILITEPMVKTILLDDQSAMGTEPLCWLGVPLIVKDKTIGVVAVQSYREEISYSPDDRDVLMIIANQIALAISEKQTEAKLIYTSTHDELTGLYNRAYYEDEVQRLSAGRNEPVGVIMMDIDGLKRTNDEYGHGSGDLLIKEAAKLIHGVFRTNDVLARIGGDEFAVLLPESNTVVVQEGIRRVMAKLGEHKHPDLPVKLSLSVGGCTTENHSLQEAIHLADQEMYRMKAHRKLKSDSIDK